MGPQRQFAVAVARRLQEAGFRALWAGGCVRDFLLGRDPQDYDIATDARPEQVRQLFGHRKTAAVGASFGVILVRGPKEAGTIEVATFRTEGPYLDGRRPESVTFTTAEEDAQRRDFTINGMFYDPIAQNVLDFIGGERDLSAGLVRAIGDPHDRMREDKLRMLRAIRFAAALEFELDPTTAAAIREMADEIHVVSAERIAQELRKMLVDSQRRRAMELARQVGLLSQIFPELEPLLGTEPTEIAAKNEADAFRPIGQMLHLLEGQSFETALAVLLHGLFNSRTSPEDVSKTIGRICRRLRLSNRETEQTVWLLVHQYALRDAPQLKPAPLKRLLAHPLIHDLLAVSRVQRIVENDDLAPIIFCEEFLQNTPAEEINPPPLVTGDDLITRGLSPGPQFRELLTIVRDAQLNGKITTPVEALELVDRLQRDRLGDR